MSRSRKLSPTDEQREAPDGRWASVDSGHGGVGHHNVFSLAEYDYPDRHLLRTFCTVPAISWSAFRGVRKGNITLNDALSKGIAEDLTKLMDGGSTTVRGQNRISEPVNSIGEFLSEHYPELCITKSDAPQGGATFLLLAVVTGDIELARRCLELGANPNNMSFLSDPNVSVNQMQHGYSPMFIAVIAGNLEMMALLHRFGGSVHVYDRWGRTPLHAAVAMGNAEVVRWLQEKGAPRCIGNCMTIISDPTAHACMALSNPALCHRSESYGNAVSDGGVEKTEEEEKGERTTPCHCHSGQPRGSCGCVDDMFLRWSYDRLQSRWQPAMNFGALAAKYETGRKPRSCVE